MKRKIIQIMGLFTVMALLAGCGGKDAGQGGGESASSVAESSAESGSAKTPVTADTPLKDIMVEEYVTLCDYKAMKLEPQKAGAEEIEESTRLFYLDMYPEDMGVKDRAVKTGDTANIDFEGKRDGVAFPGGTSQGYNLTIGSGQFIAGFEDGLIGVMPGETVDLPLRFPDNYGNDLAGQEVIFTVTVNYIIPEGIDDAAVKAMDFSDASDAAGLRKYVEDALNKQYREEMENQALAAFIEKCKFETLPDVLMEKYRSNLKRNMEQSAISVGMELESFMLTYYGMDLESFLATYAEQSLKMNLACQALANQEQLNVSDEELDSLLQNYAGQAGYNSVEEYMGDTPKEEFREFFMYQNVMDYLAENIIAK